MDSLQSSLREAMYRARKRDVHDKESHGRLSGTFSIRAKYLSYGFDAASTDQSLSHLWFLAAKKQLRNIDLNIAPTRADTDKSKEYVAIVASTSKKWAALKSEVRITLIQRVAYHYRYAAALSALGRPHSHDYAAELYLQAFSLVSRVTEDASVTPGEATLIERAAVSWQLAAEMVAAQADGNGALKDKHIQSAVTAAKTCAADVQLFVSYVATVDELKAAAVATQNTLAKCRDAATVPVWRALVVQQDTVLAEAARCLDRFVRGELSATETAIAMSEIRARLSVTPEHVQEYQLYSTKSTYYKQMAAQAMQTNPFMPRSRDCWAQAAVHIDAAMQMQLDIIVSGEQRSPNKAVVEMEAAGKVFARSAEYLFLAFKHRTLLDAETSQHGTHVAVLYEQMVEILPFELDASARTTVKHVVDQYLALIGALNGSEATSEDVIAARKLVCEYGRFAVSCAVPVDKQLWKNAYNLLSRAVPYGVSNECFHVRSAAARLYACAVLTVVPSERMCFESAADAFSDALAAFKDSNELVLYNKVLAQTILAFGPGLDSLPNEVTSFLAQVEQQSIEEEELRTMAEEHARYVTLRNRLKCAESGHARDVWLSSQFTVDTLLGLLRDWVENIFVNHATDTLFTKITYYALLVKCYVAHTEAPPNSAVADAWTEVVDKSQAALLSQKNPASQVEIDIMYGEAIVRIKRAMQE
eukprot:gene8391-9967_t